MKTGEEIEAEAVAQSQGVGSSSGPGGSIPRGEDPAISEAERRKKREKEEKNKKREEERKRKEEGKRKMAAEEERKKKAEADVQAKLAAVAQVFHVNPRKVVYTLSSSSNDDSGDKEPISKRFKTMASRGFQLARREPVLKEKTPITPGTVTSTAAPSGAPGTDLEFPHDPFTFMPHPHKPLSIEQSMMIALGLESETVPRTVAEQGGSSARKSVPRDFSDPNVVRTFINKISPREIGEPLMSKPHDQFLIDGDAGFLAYLTHFAESRGRLAEVARVAVQWKAKAEEAEAKSAELAVSASFCAKKTDKYMGLYADAEKKLKAQTAELEREKKEFVSTANKLSTEKSVLEVLVQQGTAEIT